MSEIRARGGKRSHLRGTVLLAAFISLVAALVVYLTRALYGAMSPLLKAKRVDSVSDLIGLPNGILVAVRGQIAGQEVVSPYTGRRGVWWRAAAAITRDPGALAAEMQSSAFKPEQLQGPALDHGPVSKDDLFVACADGRVQIDHRALAPMLLYERLQTEGFRDEQGRKGYEALIAAGTPAWAIGRLSRRAGTSEPVIVPHEPAPGIEGAVWLDGRNPTRVQLVSDLLLALALALGATAGVLAYMS